MIIVAPAVCTVDFATGFDLSNTRRSQMSRMCVSPHLCLDENPPKIWSHLSDGDVFVSVSDEVWVSFAISGTPDQVRATLAAMIAAIDTAEVD